MRTLTRGSFGQALRQRVRLREQPLEAIDECFDVAGHALERSPLERQHRLHARPQARRCEWQACGELKGAGDGRSSRSA